MAFRMMGGGRIPRLLLLLATYVLYVSGLPMENQVEDVNYMNGFQDDFAKGMPTEEFQGHLPVNQEHSRSKRQVRVSEDIAAMLSKPYDGPYPEHISSLFSRNSLNRPVRHSLSSDQSRRFPQAYQPSNAFFFNQVEQPERVQVRKQAPQTIRPSVQQPARQLARRPAPTHQSIQNQRRPSSPQQNFSLFPTFSEAQSENKNPTGQSNNNFPNADGAFESFRIRNKREVTSQQAAVAEERQDTQGFMPNNFPSFESVGGFDEMPDEVDQSSTSFVVAFDPPNIEIPDIKEENRKFVIPPMFKEQLSN